MEDGGSSVPPFSVGQCYSPHLPYAIRIAWTGHTADNGSPALRQRSTRIASARAAAPRTPARRARQNCACSRKNTASGHAILLLCTRQSIGADGREIGRLASMKTLVLETTAPFQGLPELVAYDEGLFEREGLRIEWADREKEVEKKTDINVISPKGLDPFSSHGKLLEQGQADMYNACEWGNYCRVQDTRTGSRQV